MKMNVVKISLLSVLIFTSACMSINITSTSDQPSSEKTYRHPLILARFTDVPFRTKAETIFKNNLLKYAKTDSTISIAIFTPIRDYSEQEIKKALADKAIDGIILFRLVSSMRDTRLHGKEYEQIIDAVNYSVPPTIARDPNRNYEVSLIDAVTGKTVWIGTVSISSKRPYRSQNIVDPISTEAIKKLQELKMLPGFKQGDPTQ